MLVWQLSQLLVLAIWLVLLPVAVVPLWQLAQLPVTLACEKVAGSQALVRWQSEHWAVVGTWLAGLPGAAVPLWQPEHDPVTAV